MAPVKILNLLPDHSSDSDYEDSGSDRLSSPEDSPPMKRSASSNQQDLGNLRRKAFRAQVAADRYQHETTAFRDQLSESAHHQDVRSENARRA